VDSAAPVQHDNRSPSAIYRERIFGFWTNLIFGVVFAGLIVAICLLTPLRSSEEFGYVYWVLLGALIVVGLLWIALSHLALRFDEAGFTVRMGVFGLRRPWSAVTGVRRDERGRGFYGGWGVKGRKIDGKWVQAFTTTHPRIVLELDDPDYRELVFSTRKPQRVLEVIEEYAGPFD
jgi:hypothetical protein